MKQIGNPRRANGSLRNKHRQRLKAMGLPCHICGKPINYDVPSNYLHPDSFVCDEIIPVSRWEEFGYSSARACAEDFNNLAPAHYQCNAMKGNRLNYKINEIRVIPKRSKNSGQW